MRFLGGFLKFLAILIMIVATMLCTAVSVAAAVMEAYLAMGLAWLCTLLVCLNIWGTGIALTQVAKLKKKVRQLEQQLAAPAPVYRAAPSAAPDAMPEIKAEEIPAPLQTLAESYAAAPPVTPTPKKAKKSKKWIPVVIILVLVLVVGIVGVMALNLADRNTVANDRDVYVEYLPAIPAATEAPAEAACGMRINGICVDDSYTDEEGRPLKMVYLFYTLSAGSENLKIDSKYTKMYIGGNEYESDHFANVAAACKYTTNYYYGSYIEDVYVGSEKNVIATFYIPEGDLTGGKTVTFSDSQIPGIESISANTDEFQHFPSPEDIAIAMDPEGYELSLMAREEADAATTKQVRGMLNDRYWSFYVNNTSYRLEFSRPNKFSLTTAFGTSSGTYSVRKGYVFCTYSDTGYTVEIPYEIVNGKMDLDTIGGFDVRG